LKRVWKQLVSVFRFVDRAKHVIAILRIFGDALAEAWEGSADERAAIEAEWNAMRGADDGDQVAATDPQPDATDPQPDATDPQEPTA